MRSKRIRRNRGQENIFRTPKPLQIPLSPGHFPIFVLVSTLLPPYDKQGGFDGDAGKVCRGDRVSRCPLEGGNAKRVPPPSEGHRGRNQ